MLHIFLVSCCNCNSSGVKLVETIDNRYYISRIKEIIAPPKFLDFVKWKMSSYASLTMILCWESFVLFNLRMAIWHCKKAMWQILRTSNLHARANLAAHREKQHGRELKQLCRINSQSLITCIKMHMFGPIYTFSTATVGRTV